MLAKVLRELPPRPSDLRPAVGAALDHLVMKLLAKDRDARPKDAADLLRALDAL